MKPTSVKFYDHINLTDDEIKQIFDGVFLPGEPVNIKIHFGEPGNTTAFTPEIVRPYIDALNEMGFKTVLWDCPVFYPSPRKTKKGYEKVVRKKGFMDLTNCEICNEYDSFELHDGEVAEISKMLTEAKNLLVLTHVKGHPCAGFGATIKNIGIGASSPKTKGLIHQMRNLLQHFGWDPDRLGEVVAKGWKHMPREHFLAINIIRDVTKHCDCVGHTTPIIAPDLGVLVSNNVVAIDQASLDMIENATRKGIFFEKNGIDPQLGIDATAKYSGLTKEYRLKKM